MVRARPTRRGMRARGGEETSETRRGKCHGHGARRLRSASRGDVPGDSKKRRRAHARSGTLTATRAEGDPRRETEESSLSDARECGAERGVNQARSAGVARRCDGGLRDA